MNDQAEFDFRGRRSNEKVMMVARYHPWLLMPIPFAWIFIIIISSVIIWYFGASKVSSIVVATLALLGLLYSLYQWFIWNNGNFIITDQRVIRTEQMSLFNKRIAEAELDRIQEISTDISGPIRTMFNFGTVKIQTASNSGRLDLQDVADPYDIQQVIVRVQHQTAESKTTPRPANRLS